MSGINRKTEEKENGAKVGVFLCTCGGKISSKVDLAALEKIVSEYPVVNYVETVPYPCLGPGLDTINQRIIEKGLNRIVVSGCEYRIMLQKFEKALEAGGIEKGEIDIV
ncbi:MAG: hypothetical protein ABII06_16115, partial [Pseudomonadota bacterium]